jgi:hypothetical protein
VATIHDQYVGAVDEVTYGTAVAVTKFFEYRSEGIAGKYERIDSEAIRAGGGRALRSDRFAVNPKGAEGDLKLEVLSDGFTHWFKHMFGGFSDAAPGGGFTVHTYTVGDLNGKSFTTQVGRWGSGGTLYPFTYAGGKVKDWELSNAVDEVLQLSLSLDFATESQGAGAGALALSTPTYPALAKLFTFQGGTVTVGGSQFNISDFSIKGDNGLKTDRYFIKTGGVKAEPLEDSLRKFEFSLKGEFVDLTQAQRVSAATTAGALGVISVTWDGPDLSQLKVDIPFARFDEGSPNSGGREVNGLDLSGVCLTDGTASPVTITYKALT